MRTWATFLDFVIPWVAGVEQPMAEFAIRRSAIEFFTESRCHRADLAAVSTVAESSAALTLTMPDTSMEIVQIERVIYDEDDLNPVIVSALPASMLSETGEPELFYRDAQAGALRILPIPDDVYSLSPSVSLRPTATATGVFDNNLADRYTEAIGFGAIGRLLAMPRKPWTDAGGSIFYTGKFNSAVIDARDEADHGSTNSPARVRSCFGLR